MTAFPCATRCRSHGRWFVGSISCGPPSPCTKTTTLFGVPVGTEHPGPVGTGADRYRLAVPAAAAAATSREEQHDEARHERRPHPTFRRQSRNETGSSASTASGSESSRTELVLCCATPSP